MSRPDRRRAARLALLALVAALAPAPAHRPGSPSPDAPDDPATRARLRAESGARAFDLAWLYYSENRIDADAVYRWSRRLLEADRDTATDKAGRVAAAEAHLGRMLKLEAKIDKIRRLGFGTTLDVAGAEYYRVEAESWRAADGAR